MPTVPRNTALIPMPPHFAFPNLVPPARVVPPDFELWPEVRIGSQLISLDLAGFDLRAITLPVTPTIPPTVASGDLITASHENAVRQALNDLWIDVQALASKSVNDPTTAKGQILVRGSSAVEAMPAGVNGQVLIADSTQTQGLRWTALDASTVGAVPVTRQVIAGTGLTGGGALAEDVTLSANIAAIQTPWLQHIDGGGWMLRNVGQIGIGVTPTFPLHVRVTAGLNVALFSASGVVLMGAYNDAGNAAVPLRFDAARFEFSTGYIGIGTQNPTSLLEVASTSPAIRLRNVQGSVSDSAEMLFSSYLFTDGSDIRAKMRFETITGGNGEIGWWTGTASGLQEQMRLTWDGQLVLKNLPTATPGAGSKKLWYDPADGNRVKFAP